MEKIATPDYTVFFGDPIKQLLHYAEKEKPSKIFFVADDKTVDLCLPRLTKDFVFPHDIIEVPSGEAHKTIDYCIGIWELLLDFGAERNSLIVNVGGGVVTDMGGFAASTFKRGIRFIQVPTTLLSMVDASVGGKTGIDIRNVKNGIGTFTQPQAVLIDPAFLATLDEKQMRSGFAEMLKHGLITDEKYFTDLAVFGYKNLPDSAIHRSVEIKNEVVTKDPLEHGLRKTLNFGHTIGHAIEGFSLLNDTNPLLHGEAIAAGMIAESFLSHKRNGLPESDLNRIVHTIMQIYPKYELQPDTDQALIDLMKNDKKNRDGRIGVALLSRIGHCDFDLYTNEEDISDALQFYRDLPVLDRQDNNA